MLERFDRDSRAVVVDARAEAKARWDPELGAEHLLLAISRRPASPAGRLLTDAGLDHERLQDALDTKTERTLAAVGVASRAIQLADRPTPMSGEPRWGTSAKLALKRSLSAAKAHGDRSIRPPHILLGALRAQEGRVPRALAAAGISAAELADRAEATLG